MRKIRRNGLFSSFPIIGKPLKKSSNHWKFLQQNFQSLETFQTTFPMIGKVFSAMKKVVLLWSASGNEVRGDGALFGADKELATQRHYVGSRLLRRCLPVTKRCRLASLRCHRTPKMPRLAFAACCLLLVAALTVFTVPACANDYRMPQDSWYFSHSWGTNGTGSGEFNFNQKLHGGALPGVAVTTSLVYIADGNNHRIQVFDFQGNYISQWGSYGTDDGQFNVPSGIALGSNGLVYVVDHGNNRIQSFDSNGNFIRKWGNSGSQSGEFSSPQGIACANDGYVYVVDSGNSRIQVFNSEGIFEKAWGSSGAVAGQFQEPIDVAIGCKGNIYVSDKSSRGIQVFSKDGAFIEQWNSTGLKGISLTSDNLLIAGFYQFSSGFYLSVFSEEANPLHVFRISKTSVWSESAIGLGISKTEGLVFIADSYAQNILVYKGAYRLPFCLLGAPKPYTRNVNQRPGLPYLDIDYCIYDTDSPQVTAAAAAFANGAPYTLTNFVKVSTFVEGTDTNVGANVSANVTNRLTWNVAADWDVEYADVEMMLMAKDEWGLLDIGFLTLPEDGTNTALTISSSPITPTDLLPLWFWLLANSDSAIKLEAGQVIGVGGSYDGVKLAENRSTTAEGRAFLFERIGVREATAAELERARNGASGVVNQWALPADTVTAGPGDRPKAINEYGFDTGNWGADAWWVVR